MADALTALRAMRAGVLCRACAGRGTIVRRTRVGSRPVGGGLRIPVFANIEGSCTTCDGEGCPPAQRVIRLGAVAIERLREVPEEHGLRSEVLVAARRTLEELLAAGAAALARRTLEIARDALIRAQIGPVDLLVVLSPTGRPAKQTSGGTKRLPETERTAPTSEFSIDGVTVRLVAPQELRRQESAWTAILGRLRAAPDGQGGRASDAADAPAHAAQHQKAALVLEVLVFAMLEDPTPGAKAPPKR